MSVTLKNGLTMAQIGPSRGTRPERLVQDRVRLFYPNHSLDNHRIGLDPELARAVGLKRSYVEADVVVPRLMLAIFVDGRFWHDPELAARKQRPHHKVDWVSKARANQARDAAQTAALREMGWRVVRIWDTDLKGKGRTESTLGALQSAHLMP